MDTPAIIIDSEKVTKNINKMNEIARNNKVKLRPHIKTHKLPVLAKEQLNAGAIGITAAKLSEAEVMADYGINNIFIAYPMISEEKIAKAIKLSQKVKLILGVDSLLGARRLSEMAYKNQVTVEIRLEVDTGLERTGISYDQVVENAKVISTYKNLKLSGIYTFRGPILNGQPTLNIVEAGREEGQMMVKLADELRQNGIAIEDVSVGSTSTSLSAATVPGVTEIRPGTYVFYDAMQEKYGCCTEDDCAAVVKVTVISKPTENRAIIDGGSKTFATDVQPNLPPLYLKGFGKVVGHPNIVFERVTEEHGMLRIEGESTIQVGDTLEIIPNHICSTINLHNDVFMKDKNQSFKRYQVLARGKLQ